MKVELPAKSPVTPAKGPAARAGVAAAAVTQSPPVGGKKVWPLINFNTGGADFERFTLRAVGAKIDLGVRHARLSSVGLPQSRDGTGGLLEQAGVVPPGYYAGPGEKVVTLVANFKDENYADIGFPSYVAGYHSSDINGFVNRNVMSVDSYDWVHRTGASPPNEPSSVLCSNRPAQPFKYEGVFSHEYQHLLEFWASPGESTWVNEGLSDYAITVTGYGFPSRSIFETGYEGHIQTFLGWRALQTPANLIPQPKGGPENSLTVWDDQGGLETLADYGTAFMTDVLNEDGKGLKGLQTVLDKYLTGDKAQAVVRDWAAMVALDKAIDDGARVLGVSHDSRYQTSTLSSSVYWENPEAYSTPGAPPNGSDYVLLRDSHGKPLSASNVKSI